MPANRQHIPTPELARQWPHLEGIADKLMPLNDGAEVGILIGYNCSGALAPREVIPPVHDEPYAQCTDLGWCIVGIVEAIQDEADDDVIGVSHRVLTREVPQLSTVIGKEHPSSVTFSFRTTVKEIITPLEVTRMLDLDFNEHKSNNESLSQDDRTFLNRMTEGIHLTTDNHYEMPLPFRVSAPNLPCNKVMAVHRLKHLKKRMMADNKYHEDYTSFMENIVQNGYAEKVPTSELPNESGTWYIPHHGIYHAKKPGKIRIVFDCSAKFKGQSLNDHLLQGPDLTNTLVGVSTIFREEPVALICDIEQMFFQFRVNAEHRDYLRFLWWDNGDYNTTPIDYRMKVHLFGTASSPGCSNFGLKQAATDNESECGSEAANFIRGDFYVDDGLKSLPDETQAITLIADNKGICSKAGLRLHKFLSNSKNVIASIPTEDQAKGIKDLDLNYDNLPVERALGVQWCVESDEFQFQITLKDHLLTRRGVLATISSIFDPLGFIAPILLVGKQILQTLCKENADWNDPLPNEIHPRWERWRGSLLKLENLKIPRCFKPCDFGVVKRTELHHFSDASTQGYGQCTYLRLINEHGHIHCSFVTGKARVSPLRTITIPRLELTAALVSAKVSCLLQRELNLENVSETFWTDSKVVLGYIANDSRRFHVFVGNRVQQIRDSTELSQWNYVKTSDNPADCASRGLAPEELVGDSTWCTGPKFLWCDSELKNTHGIDIVLEGDPEIKKGSVFATAASSNTDQSDPDITRFLEYFSSWYRLKRATAVWIQLQRILRDRASKISQPSHDPIEDLQMAEQSVIKLIQASCYPEEIGTLPSVGKGISDRKLVTQRKRALKGTSPLYRLNPFIDEDGILRVGGRLKNASLPASVKFPIILPRKHHVTQLIIRHFHEKLYHQGRGMTISEIRSNGFWIIGCTSAVSSYIRK